MFNHRRPCFLIVWRSFSHPFKARMKKNLRTILWHNSSLGRPVCPSSLQRILPWLEIQTNEMLLRESTVRGNFQWNSKEGNTTHSGPNPLPWGRQLGCQTTQIHVLPIHLHPVFAVFLVYALKWTQGLVAIYGPALPHALPRHIFPWKEGWGQRELLFHSHLLFSQPHCCAGSSWCGRSRRSLSGKPSRAPGHQQTPWRSGIRIRCYPRSRPKASPGASPWALPLGCSHRRRAHPPGRHGSWRWPPQLRSPHRWTPSPGCLHRKTVVLGKSPPLTPCLLMSHQNSSAYWKVE